MEKSKLNPILNSTTIAYAYHQIITDSEGNPVDYVFLEANQSFQKYTGLEIDKIINKKVTEILPNIKNDPFDWIGVYGEIARNKGQKTFEQFSTALGRWYEIEALSDSVGYFYTFIKDITESVKFNREMSDELFNISKMFFELESKDLPYDEITDFVCRLTGASYGVFNLYSADGKTFTNKALSGISRDWTAATKMIGFKIKDQTWEISDRRVFEIKGGKAIKLDNLKALADDKIPGFICNLISRTFNLGPIYIQEISDKGKTLGDLILLFNKNGKLKNSTTLATFANMIGMAINNRKAQLQLETQHQIATEANKFYNLILESIQDGINILSPDLTILKSNSIMQQFHQETKPVEGNKCYQVFFKDSIPCRNCPAVKCTQTGNVEQELLKTEILGELKYIELTAYPMMNPQNGSIEAIVEIVRDVTEKETVKKKLRVSDENLKNFFNSSIDFLWVLDLQGNIMEVNPTVYKRLCYNHGELIGQSIHMVHPLGRRIEAQQIAGEILDGKRTNCLIPLITKSGDEISVETRFFKCRWNEHDVLFGVSRDLSELKFSEEKFAAAFRNNPAIAGLSDVETGKYIEVNDAFIEKIGYTREEVIGHTASEIFKLDSEFRIKTIQELVKNGFVRNIETVLPSKSGKIIQVLLSAELLKIHDKLLNYTTAIDITDRVNSEKALVKQNAKLKSLILENDNLNEDLRFAVAKAEDSDRLKTTFLANMSHEIRTPMNAIIGFSSFLSDEELSFEDRKKYTGIIIKSGNHLLHLINNIIDISKIEAGEIKIIKIATDISVLLMDIFDLFDTQIINKDKSNFEFRILIPQETLILQTDETRVRQIFINLISNAIKFTSEGFVEFGFELKESDVVFMVRDSGIGVEAEKKDEIFERFKQASDNTEKLYGGTGLGLSIVKSYVEMLGGKIWIESELNQGTEFYFSFPLHEDE